MATTSPVDTVPATLEMIPIAKLHDHPHNPRKYFDERSLAELTESVRLKGVLVPLSVRKDAKGFEVLGGARRLRAAKAAGLELVPALVRDCDDTTALEIVVLDNLQRSDLHPLEEADGFHQLLRQPGYDVAKVAARVGRSVQYVYDRLKLLSLTKPAQEMFLANRFTAGHAVLLARLTPADQARALKADGNGWEDVGLFRNDMGEELFDGAKARNAARKKDPLAGMTLCSVREFATWINNNVRVDLKAAETAELFPEISAALVEVEGAQTKVVQICRDEAGNHKDKAGEKIYYEGQWRPADGKQRYRNHKYNMVVGSKCKSAALGVVVIGPGRGQAFDVCVDRSCSTHWHKEKPSVAASSEREKTRRAAEDARYKKVQQERVALQERWKKAEPAFRTAIADKLKSASVSAIGDLLTAGHRAHSSVNAKPLVARGKTADDLVRHLAYLHLADAAAQTWQMDNFTRDAKTIGVNAKAVLDAAVPATQPVQTSVKPKKKRGRK